MIIEKGKFYKTRAGAFVEINGAPNMSGACEGKIFRSGIVSMAFMSWMANGRVYSDRSSPNDLVEERQEPYCGWMCKIGNQAPMPAPDEEIARRWAETSNGRAFRVTEILE